VLDLPSEPGHFALARFGLVLDSLPLLLPQVFLRARAAIAALYDVEKEANNMTLSPLAEVTHRGERVLTQGRSLVKASA